MPADDNEIAEIVAVEEVVEGEPATPSGAAAAGAPPKPAAKPAAATAFFGRQLAARQPR